jgi:hypothetical protein
MDKKINVTHIDHTWSCCNYKYRVFVKDYGFDMERHNYIKETLKKWFGDATYYWDNMWLAGKK